MADGKVAEAKDVERFVVHQLSGRWATSDRPVLLAALAAGGDLTQVASADHLMEANNLAAESRKGSCRMGGALLNVHVKLETRGAKKYQGCIRAGTVPGHIAAVQGLLWSALGFDGDSACRMAAHGLAVNILGATLRLGLIGHIDSQTILGKLHPVIEDILASPSPVLDEIHAYAPAADIAMMRHETQESRLFYN